MKPLEGNAIMEISLDTVQTMVYRVFGGESGHNSKPKDLTVIERGVVKRITNELNDRGYVKKIINTNPQSKRPNKYIINEL